MSRTKKIAILAIIAMALTLMPAAAFAATADDTRLAGADRIATALEICSAGWTTADSVVLAPADQANLVDALAAAPLAGQENAPILLTPKNALDPAVKERIAALKAKKVYIIGAIADTVAAEVDAMSGVDIEILKGKGRQGTALAVDGKLVGIKGTFVVGYDAIPDALSVASYAAKHKFAIVIANQNGKVDSDNLFGSVTYIVGGAAKVADIAGATRLAGADRFATNAAVAEKLDFSLDRVYVANGLTLVDALSVAPLAAKYGAFVALAGNGNVAAAAVINPKIDSNTKVIAVGGESAVTEGTKGKIVFVPPGALAIQSVKALNAAEIEVVFNRNVNKDTAENPANYKIGTTYAGIAALGVGDEAKLQADKRTVKIKFATTGIMQDPPAGIGNAGVMQNKTNYVLEVQTGIKDTEGNALDKAYVFDVFMNDTTKPAVNSVAMVDGLVQITYSEPLGTLPTVAINGMTVPGGPGGNVAFGGTPNVVNVTVPTTFNLKNGTSYPIITFGGADLGNYNTQNLYSGTFTYSNVATAPKVVGLTVKDELTLVAEFNKHLGAGNFLVGNVSVFRGTTNVGAAGVTPIENGTKKYEITLNTAGLFAAGADTAPLTVTIEGYKDAANNIGTKFVYNVTVTKDKVKPYITSVDYDFVSKLITFHLNEPVDGTATAASIQGKLTITNNANGVGITPAAAGINPPAAGTKSFTIDSTAIVATPPAALEPGTYTFSFGSETFTDQNVNANKSAAQSVTVKITGSATAKPLITGVAEVTKDQFTVTFNQKVKGGAVAGSATDPANYKLNGAALPAGTAISLNEAKTIATVTMPTGSVNRTQTFVLSVANVQNDAGTAMDPADLALKLTDSAAPVLLSASVDPTDSYSIIAVFSEQINDEADYNGDLTKKAVPADFVLTVNGVDIDPANYTVDTITGAGNEFKLKIKSTTVNFATGTITLKTKASGPLMGADAAGNTLKPNVTVDVTR